MRGRSILPKKLNLGGCMNLLTAVQKSVRGTSFVNGPPWLPHRASRNVLPFFRLAREMCLARSLAGAVNCRQRHHSSESLFPSVSLCVSLSLSLSLSVRPWGKVIDLPRGRNARQMRAAKSTSPSRRQQTPFYRRQSRQVYRVRRKTL